MMPMLFIKATIVLAVALAATRLARRSSAAVRHVFLAAAFAALLGLPIASVVAPTIRIAAPTAVQESAVWSFSPALPVVSTGAGGETPTAPPPSSWLSLSSLLLSGWMIVSIVFLLPIGAGLWQMRALRKAGMPWPEGQTILETLATEAGVQRRIGVLLHESVSGPMTCGVIRPTVLLPVDAPTWKRDDLRRAIIHELEHVRRGDWLTQCFTRAVCAGYWFHPLVWIAKRQLVLEAEHACDDAVLRRADATAYADQLVELAERLSSTSNRPLLAMAAPGDLTKRVRAVLDARQRRGQAGRLCLAIASVTAASFVVAVSSFQIVATAQQAGAAPSQGAPQLQFDAVSVRPISAQQLRDQNLPLRFLCRGADGEYPQNVEGFEPAPLGRCVGNVVLYDLIMIAYGLPDRHSFRIMGYPEEFELTGPESLLYQIQATAPNPSRATKAELQEMVKTLLRDRFKFKAHSETRVVDGFFLVIARGGPKFKETTLDEEPLRLVPKDPGGPETGGVLPMIAKGRFGMKAIARFASGYLAERAAYGPPVTDRTGLSGVYDMTILTDLVAPMSGERRGGGAGGPHFNPTIPRVLEEQLGLRLEPAKHPVEHLIIDNIERPSEN
jgi:uncharacterized protein (TIGR03435 family)